MFAGKKSAQIREILISESAWEEMTCLFAPSLSALLAALEWIDAVPSDTVLPAMPGFDRDEVNELIANARKELQTETN